MKTEENQLSALKESRAILGSFMPFTKKTLAGKKVYICPYENCQKAFSESGNLKTHIRIHVTLLFVEYAFY